MFFLASGHVFMVPFWHRHFVVPKIKLLAPKIELSTNILPFMNTTVLRKNKEDELLELLLMLIL